MLQVKANWIKLLFWTRMKSAMLQEKFYVEIPYAISRPLIHETMDGFLKFLSMDQQVKDHLVSLHPGNHRRKELGLIHRLGNQAGEDTKICFHYHPYLMREHRDYISADPALNHFISHVDTIWNHAVHATKQILTCLNHKYDNVYAGVFETEEPHVILRIVYYQTDSNQHILARPHFDAGSFTLAVAESAPGLRIGSTQENLKLVPYREDTLIFMLGANFHKLIPPGALLPSWHDVIRLDQLHTRWAIVVFIDGHSVGAPSRDETHHLGNKL